MAAWWQLAASPEYPTRSRDIARRARGRLISARGRALQGALGTVAQAVTRHRILHCLGDSHVRIFNHITRLRLLRRTWLEAVPVDGATAMGLVNPNSTTNALMVFRQTIRRLRDDRHVLFMLGEVDCGFVIWYRAERLGVPVEEQLEVSLDNYTSFLQELLPTRRGRLLLAAVPPPTIVDGAPGPVAKARLDVKASIAERTKLTVRYNEALRRWSHDHDCDFLDYESEVIDHTTGLVREDLRNPNPEDHHLAAGRFAPIVAAHLRAAGYS